MENKQTAINWLIEQIREQGVSHFYSTRELLEKAKEMEKEQIITAYMAVDNPLQRVWAETYYNETYGK